MQEFHSWKKVNKINKYSIGIEIHNPGHQLGISFNKKQINSIKYLSLKLAKKYKIKDSQFFRTFRYFSRSKKRSRRKIPWEFLSKYRIGIWHSLNKKYLKKYRLKNINNLDKKYF